MARIRSVHPGLFTDEAFMSASPHARLLILGIWCEAWDDGVFDWKPLTLKARIFPVDAVDVPALLSELVSLNFVSTFRVDGKDYGAVRNFQKYQRPKKPNSSGLLPESLRSYVGSGVTSSELVPNQSGTPSEKPPQREDGGGREGEENNNQQQHLTAEAPEEAAAAADLLRLEEIERRCIQATGWERTGGISAIADLVSSGVDLDDRILPILRMLAAERRKKGEPHPGSFVYAVKAIQDPTRRVEREAAPVAQVWVSVGSPKWAELIANGKKESFLRLMVKRAADGSEGVWASPDWFAKVAA